MTTSGESHRARAQRIIETNGSFEFAVIHALLAIEERLHVIANGTSDADTRRLDADDHDLAARNES